MKEGFTTGSCAAAAALASCLWRRDGTCPEHVEIIVPEGRTFRAEIRAHAAYTCGVLKDAGDDPDVTNGCEVCACADVSECDGPVTFAAGEGVGTVTRAGLKVPVGEPAINPVPREMIQTAIRQVYPARAAMVTVSIPGGAEIAKKTFNPRLGVEGGLSILGTTGIVRPMSEAALTESIALELAVRRAAGNERIALAFGNQGEAAFQKLAPGVATCQMSNYVGFALDEAVRLGFSRILIVGHPGKLVKIAAGVMQTHSKYADARREPILAELSRMRAPVELIEKVDTCVTTSAVIAELTEAGFDGVWNRLAERAQAYCAARVREGAEIDILFLDGAGVVLGQSKRMREETERWRMR